MTNYTSVNDSSTFYSSEIDASQLNRKLVYQGSTNMGNLIFRYNEYNIENNVVPSNIEIYELNDTIQYINRISYTNSTFGNFNITSVEINQNNLYLIDYSGIIYIWLIQYTDNRTNYIYCW